MLAADQIRAGHARTILAGGFESMTNAPYLLPKARGGYRYGHGEIYDHMLYDGLQSPWDGRAMGVFADQTAAKYGYTREQQDAFGIESVRRAQRAVKDGDFAAEIAPVTVKTRKGEAAGRAGRNAVFDRRREGRRAQAGLRQGRHGDRGLLLVDFRRRRGHDRHDRALRHASKGSFRLRGSSPTAATRRRPSGLRPRRDRRSARSSIARAGKPAQSTSTRSTRPLPA